MRHAAPSFFCLPMQMIRKVERLARGKDSPYYSLELQAKDLRVLRLAMMEDVVCDQVAKHISRAAFPSALLAFHAFSLAPSREVRPGWSWYNVFGEF